MTDHHDTPSTATTPTTAAPAAPRASASPAGAPSPVVRRRGPLIASIVAGALVVAGVSTGAGIAIGSGLDDEERTAQLAPTTPDSGSTASSSTERASTGPAADFVRARDAALAAVPGSATEIVRVGDGWTVDVRRDADAADIDVALGADFSVARVGDPDGSADGGDLRPLGSLAGDALVRAIDAAVAHAGPGGRVTAIELADTAPEAYEVELSRAGVETTISLGADGTVLHTEQGD